MKNLRKICIFIFTIILFYSCSSSKHSSSPTKIIAGNWQLQKIVSEGVTGKMNFKLFDEANFNCFVGSSWSFTSKDHLGTYSISKNADECAAAKRNISWSIDEPADKPKQFYFKRIDGNSEFRFTIVQLDKNTMQLKSDAVVDGNSATFTYNFIRM